MNRKYKKRTRRRQLPPKWAKVPPKCRQRFWMFCLNLLVAKQFAANIYTENTRIPAFADKSEGSHTPKKQKKTNNLSRFLLKNIAKVGSYGRFDVKIGILVKF